MKEFDLRVDAFYKHLTITPIDTVKLLPKYCIQINLNYKNVI